MAAATSSKAEEGRKLSVFENLKKLDAKVNDRLVMEQVYKNLLDIKTGQNEQVLSREGYIYCFLIIETVLRASKKMRFRVLLLWTGLQVKQEIQRLYEIATDHQTLIINDQVVSDQEILSDFDFKLKGQVLYVFLCKRRIDYVESPIRVSDFLPMDETPMDVAAEINPVVRHADVMEVDSDVDSNNSSNPDAAAQATAGDSLPQKKQGQWKINNKNRKKKKNKRR